MVFAKASGIDPGAIGQAIKRKGYRVELVKDPFQCPGAKPGQQCVGYFSDTKKLIRIVSHPADCIAMTSFAHEVAHAILYNVYGNADPTHSFAPVWRAVLPVSQRGACRSMCPVRCPPPKPTTKAEL